MIKAIGTAARRELERELGTQVHLDLSVRVRRALARRRALLDRLGDRVAAGFLLWPRRKRCLRDVRDVRGRGPGQRDGFAPSCWAG